MDNKHQIINTKIFDEDLIDSTYNKIEEYGSATFERMLVPPTDGLKPVNRRILFVLWEENVKDHTKMATLAGAVLRYHPHGDKSVSDAMSKMGQWFYMNYPLIDPQGNFGNLDGDPPSAPRYIEAKPSQFAIDVLLQDLDWHSVDYKQNYDFKRIEPTYLPSRLPLLLVEGTEGIAVAFSSSIPSHNINDVVAMCIKYIKNKNIPNEELVDGVFPDFPTGGIIVNKQEVEEYYKYQKPCSLHICGKTRIDYKENTIIIEELPYGVTFDKIRDAIIENRNSKKELSVFNKVLRAERNNKQNYWEIEYRKDENLNNALKNLYLYTPLDKSRPLQFIINVDNKPKLVTIKEIIEYWYDFRVQVKKRIFTHEMNTLQNKVHILEGIYKSYSKIDEIISTIRESTNKDDTIKKLVSRFDLTMVQAKGIYEMSLGSLSKYSENDLKNQIDKIHERINIIVTDLLNIDSIIIQELEELREKYKRPRRTILLNENDTSIDNNTNNSENIIERGVLGFTSLDIGLFNDVFLLENKRIDIGYTKQSGGIIGITPITKRMISIILFFNDGTCVKIPPTSINMWTKLIYDAHIIAVAPVYKDNDYIVCITQQYKIKAFKANEITSRKSSSGDVIVTAYNFESGCDIFICSNTGEYCYFNFDDSIVQSRTASGIKLSFEKTKHTSLYIAKVKSESLITIGLDNGDNEGSIYIIDSASLKIGKRNNVPKKIKSLQNHFTITCVNCIEKNSDFKNVVFVGSKGISKISSKLIKPTGVPRRVSLIPFGVHIL